MKHLNYVVASINCIGYTLIGCLMVALQQYAYTVLCVLSFAMSVYLLRFSTKKS